MPIDSAPSPAIFLDRDGTINLDKEYLIHFEDFEPVPGTEEALRLLVELGYRLFVCTNQSGVARGYFSLEAVEQLNGRIQEYFAERGARLEAFAVCPHHPEGVIPEFTKDCACRKPKPGLILQLANKHRLDLSRSYFVGDKLSDVQAGHNSGISAVLVRSGHKYYLEGPENVPEFDSLLDFAVYLREIKG